MSVAEPLGPARKPRPGSTPAHPPRYLRLVGPEEVAALRRHRRLRLATAGLVAFVIALLFAAVGMHVILAQNQFRLDSLNSQARAQQAQYQQLQLQVDQLSAPSRIVGLAEGTLGMVPPSSVNYVAPASATSRPRASAGTTQVGPPPATAPAGWSTIKAHLAAGS